MIGDSALLATIREEVALDLEVRALGENALVERLRQRGDDASALRHAYRAAVLVELCRTVRGGAAAAALVPNIVEAVLLFHSRRWTAAQRQRWHELTGHHMITMKILRQWLHECQRPGR
jgi:hypothetical protein